MFLSPNSKRGLSLGSAIVALALIAGCGKEAVQTKPQAVPVDTFTIFAEDVPVVSRLTGRTNAFLKAEVRPQVSGIIQERLFTEGSIVKQGQQLYQIDPASYEAAVANAKANLSSAKASLTALALKAKRYGELLSSRAVSRQDYDDAKAAADQARAAVEAAAAQLHTANINLAYTKVYAPISGRIGKSDFTVGALVGAQQSQPLATIQQLDPMYVDLGQSVEDHLQLRAAVSSGKFKITDGKAAVDLYFSDGTKYPIQGSVEFADVTVDETTGMVNLRAVVANPDGQLLPGLFIRGNISEGTIPNAVLIKQGAVIREAAGTAYAYVIDEQGTAQRRDIVLGQEYGEYYVVSSGLKPGDVVIDSNIQKIRAGAKVIPADKLPKAAAK